MNKEVELKVWEYQDCEEGLKIGKCCQECVANTEKLCCECKNTKEPKGDSQ